MTHPRSNRFRVTPTTSFEKVDRSEKESIRISSKRNPSSVTVDELVAEHHPPDMAGGSHVGTRMSFPFCQEIEPTEVKPNVPPPRSREITKSSNPDSLSREVADPPGADEFRHSKNRRSSSIRASHAPSRNRSAPLHERPRKEATNNQKTNRGRNQTSNVEADRRKQRKETAYPKQVVKVNIDKGGAVAHERHRGRRRRNPSDNAAFHDFDISELTFRGPPDPPDRHDARKPVTPEGPRDPPAREACGNAVRRRPGTRRNPAAERGVGGPPKTGSSRAPCASPKASRGKEGGGRGGSGGRRRGGGRSVAMRPRKASVGGSAAGIEGGDRGASDRGTSRSKRSGASSAIAFVKAASTEKGEKRKKRGTPRIESILKKKEAPPPAFFGGLSASSSDSTSSDRNAGDFDDSAGNKTKSASTLSYNLGDFDGGARNKTKSASALGCDSRKAPSDYLVVSDSDDDDDGATSVKSSNSIKSALRTGKYAASVNHDASSSSSDDESIFSASATSRSTFTGDGLKSSFKFDRTRSYFLRTADLGLTQDTIFAQQFLDDPNSTPEPHYHHPTPHPPPGVQFDINESWICVDDGGGGHSPIAPQAVDALVATGYRAACDPMMWTPTSKTRKYMTEKRLTFESLPLPRPILEGEGGPRDTGGCLLWTGTFPRSCRGSELPVVRSQGFVNVSAEGLVDLLMDSTRVGEYNGTSAGRIDEVVLSRGNDDGCPFSGRRRKRLTGVVVQGAEIVDGTATFAVDAERGGADDPRTRASSSYSSSSSSRGGRCRGTSNFVGVTKLVRSRNRMPLIKKTLEFTTLLHCRELLDEQGGNGYIIVGRSITPADDAGGGKGVIRSEMLLNVIIIRRLHQGENGVSRTVPVDNSGRVASKKDMRNRCLMITMNHVKSSLIPKLIAKRVGLSVAKNFMSDIRALHESP